MTKQHHLTRWIIAFCNNTFANCNYSSQLAICNRDDETGAGKQSAEDF